MAPDLDFCTSSVSAAEPIHIDERKAIINGIRGQKVLVPNTMQLMPAWQCSVNPHMNEVRKEIEEWLRDVPVDEDEKTKHRVKGDYTSLMAYCYPYCSKEKLLVVTQFLYWSFFWDDAIDTGGELTEDKEGTFQCCEETKRCVDACLGPEPTPTYTPPHDLRRGTVAMFYPILRDLRAGGLGPSSTERLRREFHDYIDGVARQQQVRQDLDGPLPNPELFARMRIDDAGVIPLITQNEFAMGFEIPHAIRYHEAMETIVQGCTRMVALINEILSLQKEYRDRQLENLCLLISHHDRCSLQAAVDKILDLVRESYECCVAAEDRLPWSETDANLNNDIREYVEGCHRITTGTTYWSYYCHRYFKKGQVNEDLTVLLDLNTSM